MTKEQGKAVFLTACFLFFPVILGIIWVESEPEVKRYPIVNAYMYMETQTNGFGGVRGYEPRYGCTYVNEAGEYINMSGLYSGDRNKAVDVVAGEKDEFMIVRKGGREYRILSLTPEAMGKITINK